MVETQIAARGIRDERVIEAMGKVPRHLFVDEALRDQAYSDHPLPIAENQTISQPYVVALMTESLELDGSEKVLEIGTGSGYQSADSCRTGGPGFFHRAAPGPGIPGKFDTTQAGIQECYHPGRRWFSWLAGRLSFRWYCRNGRLSENSTAARGSARGGRQTGCSGRRPVRLRS